MDEWVRADFGLDLTRWAPAGGSDAAATVWHAWADDGREYAVKWTSGGTVAGVLVPATLALPGMPAPVQTRAGSWWSERDGKRLSVTRWVDDATTPRAPSDWVALGALLRLVHTHPVAAALDLPVDAGGTARATEAIASVASLLGDATDDVGRAAEDLWTASQPRVNAAMTLVDTMGSSGTGVLCHGDPHLGNVVRGSDGPALVDWDDAVIAPPELDLALLLGGMGPLGAQTSAERAFLLEGYGATPDPDRLTFYRCVRAVEDFALWLAVALDPGEPDRETGLRHARDVAGRGGLLALALSG